MASQLFVHRYGVYAEDGTALSFGIICWTGSPDLLVPAPVRVAGHARTYLVPLDDQPEIWLRLKGECHVMQSFDDAIRAQGNPAHVRHANGLPHPVHGHVQLGGTHSVTEPPNAHVMAHMDEMRALSEHDMARYFSGTGLDVDV